MSESMAAPRTQSNHSETRFQHVSVFIGGQSEFGTLQLTEHHLRFSYVPKSTPRGKTNRTPASLSTSRESSNITEKAVKSANDVDHAVKKTNEHAGAAHPKEIWVPYPMINYCLLRPGYSTTSHAQQLGDQASSFVHTDDDELFPPVFGTAGYGRPSTDSTRASAHASPARPLSPSPPTADMRGVPESGRQPAIRIRRRDFQMMAFHFHQPSSTDTSNDQSARRAFFLLRSRCCIQRIEDMHAFYFEPPKQETAARCDIYDAQKEFARMGISEKAADGPGTAWRISLINQDYSYSPTYPSVICVPRSVSDNMLKYGGAFRSRSRIPALSYLHTNGGSITRSSQPMVGVQNKRSPQDERLVSAIFSSHTPPLPTSQDFLPAHSIPTLEPGSSDVSSMASELADQPHNKSDTALDEAVGQVPKRIVPRVYGSTRQNLIVDARPKINALANRATGGGIEDVANYVGDSGVPVQKVFLNIANIHVMRSSLEKVVESLASADYLNIKPNQELLRKSGWLGHIGGLLDGAELVARVVGLGGSHALVHCSDGWDRTAQVSGMAQVMLDPYYRTLDGFIALVQKDFLSFGHKFHDRNGIEGSEKWFEIEHERVAPTPRTREHNSEASGLNALGSRALSGAKTWFEKNRGNLFGPQNGSRDGSPDHSPRPPSPPPNPLLHSPPTSSTKDDNHRINEKEIAPIFHQFLDAIYQLQRQNPEAFEYNERFLRRLFYHTYACQYGEFLFNNERERQQSQSKVPSVWGHFLSRRHEFTNPTFVPRVEDPLIFPRRQGAEREVEVKWWSSLFRCQDEDMNVPQILASLTEPTSSSGASTLPTNVSLEDRAVPAESGQADRPTVTDANGNIKETKSMPSLSTMRDTLAGGVSSFAMRLQAEQSESSNPLPPLPPSSSFQQARLGQTHQPPASGTSTSSSSSASADPNQASAPPPPIVHTPPTPSTEDPSGPNDPSSASPPAESDLPTTSSTWTQEDSIANERDEVRAEDAGDPLGVSMSVSTRAKVGSAKSSGTASPNVSGGSGGRGGNGSGKGLDFATFASQNAFRER